MIDLLFTYNESIRRIKKELQRQVAGMQMGIYAYFYRDWENPA